MSEQDDFATVIALIHAGFTHESAIAAVKAGDIALLRRPDQQALDSDHTPG